MDEDNYTGPADDDRPSTTADLVQSLACYVTVEDIGMSRLDFLRTVADRILDDIGV